MGDKTEVMLVSTYQKEVKLPSSTINVNFNGTLLENVNTEKLLGVMSGTHLSWKDQINKTTKTVVKHCPPKTKLKIFTPQKQNNPYKSFLQSHIDYCNIIWGQ